MAGAAPAATPLEQASERIAAQIVAGNDYVDNLESIRDKLDTAQGTTLGTMVGAQMEMTEVETRYMADTGIGKKVSSTVQQAAGDVKKAGG